MDLPMQNNIISSVNPTNDVSINPLISNKEIITLSHNSNFKIKNLNKLEDLKINHHICDNTTGESKNQSNIYNQFKDENLNFEDITERDVEEDKLLRSRDSKKNQLLNQNGYNNVNNQYSFISNENKITFPLLGRKIFRIKKYTRYNKYLNEICTESEVSEEEKNKLKDPKGKKISPFSKVNFSKLKVEEKDERLKNLAKLVKRLRRKVRNLENKVRFNASKLLNKYVWTKLGINTKNKYVPPEFSFDFDKICRALKRVRNHDDFEFADQKHLIENIINMIAEDKLKLDSISYKRICSQIRMLLNKDQIKYTSKKNSKVTITFPETEVYITKIEYNKLRKFKDKEEILRAILGVYDQDEKTIKISIDKPQEGNKNDKVENILANANEKEKDSYNLHNNILEEKKEIVNNIVNQDISNNSINNNINQSLQEKINEIINLQNGNQNNLSMFNNNIENVDNALNTISNINQTNIKNDIINADKNNLTKYQNNVFGLSLNDLNNIQPVENQENFQYNLMQNTNLLYNLNCLNGINNNIPNYVNPMQMLLLNNANDNLNPNPQFMNNYLMNQNIPNTVPNQIERNMFSNFHNQNPNNVNNITLKSPKKSNFFFENQNGSNNNLGNNNIFGSRDKNQNSSYNVFLK